MAKPYLTDEEMNQLEAAEAAKSPVKAPKPFLTDDEMNQLEAAEAAKPPISKWETGVRSGVQGATFGFGDELSGLIEAAGSKVGLRGLGGDFSDNRFETDEEDEQSFLEVYRQARDAKRAKIKAAGEANPKTAFVSELAGGALLPIGAGAAAKTVASAVIKGAGAGAVAGGLSGVGNSEAEDWKDNTWDGVKGGVIGAGTGALFGGAANVISRGATKAGRAGLGDEFAAFKRGTKEDTLLQGTPGLETAARWWNGVKSTIDTADKKAEFAAMISKMKNNTISRMVEEGGPTDGPRSARSMMDEMSNDEFIIKSLLEDGDNEVKRWVPKLAAIDPGQVGADEYNAVLKLGVDERLAAREFGVSKAKVAKEIAPMVADASDKMKGAVKSRVSQLSKEAGENFNGYIGENLTKDIWRAIEDSTSMSTIPSNITTRLQDGAELFTYGKAPSHFGLSKDFFGDADGPEQFRRLQKLRETLDLGIDWDAIKTGKRTMEEGEQILATLRGKVDAVLKATPGKIQVDEVYKLGKEIRDAVFKKSEFKGGVDEFKLKRLFDNNDTAGRFRSALGQLKEWSVDPQYAPEAREAAKAMVDKFESLYSLADKARAIGNFRSKNGPSSPAIEKLGSALNKQTLVQDAIKNPASFVQNADQFIKEFATDITGKSWKDMSEFDKNAFIKVWVKTKAESHDGLVTPEAMKDWYQRFLGTPGKK